MFCGHIFSAGYSSMPVTKQNPSAMWRNFILIRESRLRCHGVACCYNNQATGEPVPQSFGKTVSVSKLINDHAYKKAARIRHPLEEKKDAWSSVAAVTIWPRLKCFNYWISCLEIRRTGNKELKRRVFRVVSRMDLGEKQWWKKLNFR